MPDKSFSVRPLPVGAEIVGLADEGEIEAGVRSELYAAWLEYGVLLFRNVETSTRHVALSRCFGELKVYPVSEFRSKENPLLVEIGGGNRSPAYVYDGTDLRIGRLAWHRDLVLTSDLEKGGMLRMVEIPSSEGETMFADTAAAYDDLPADVKARLAGLEYKANLRISSLQEAGKGAFWKTWRRATLEEDPQGGLKTDQIAQARHPSIVHPAMLVHPESARKCIFLSPTHADCFLGMEQSESDELLRYLVAHMLKPQYVYKHRWSVNDAILWDNRRMIHAAMGNKLGEPRRALRTTLAGLLSIGRIFDDGAKVADPPKLAH